MLRSLATAALSAVALIGPDSVSTSVNEDHVNVVLVAKEVRSQPAACMTIDRAAALRRVGMPGGCWGCSATLPDPVNWEGTGCAGLHAKWHSTSREDGQCDEPEDCAIKKCKFEGQVQLWNTSGNDYTVVIKGPDGNVLTAAGGLKVAAGTQETTPVGFPAGQEGIDVEVACTKSMSNQEEIEITCSGTPKELVFTCGKCSAGAN